MVGGGLPTPHALTRTKVSMESMDEKNLLSVYIKAKGCKQPEDYVLSRIGVHSGYTSSLNNTRGYSLRL